MRNQSLHDRSRLAALGLFLACVASATPARSAEADASHHRPYAGALAGTDTFRDIRDTVERERIAALGTISRSLGLELRGDPRMDGIAFEYVDAADAPALGFPPGSRGGFRPPQDATARERLITVIVDPFAKDRDELPGFVCHEMVHATMSLLMGESFAVLPAWVQEGLAVYGSGQGADKLARLAASEGATPAEFPDGLDKQRDRPADYVEAYLAVAYLADLRGPQAVKSFTADIVKGVPVERAIENTTKLEPAEFARRAADYARTRMREASGHG